MKKTFIYTTLISSLLFVRCEKIEDINKDPNRPEDAPIYTLLKAQIISTEQRNFSAAYYWGGALAQQTARTAYTNIDRYDIALGTAGDDFTYTYRDLINIRILEDRASEAKNLSLLGAAQVLEAFQVKLLTDVYGSVPYSEAAKYDRVTGKLLVAKPKYDTQEEIYTAVIALLKTANKNLSDGAAKTPNPDVTGIGDYLFNQDNTKWRKFCNSLLLRTYIQISNKVPATATTGINEILNDPTMYPILASNSDNVSFKYLAGADKNNWNPLYRNENDRPTDYGTSATFIDYLKSMSDPRLPALAKPVTRTIAGVPTTDYWGYPNGVTSFALQVSDYGPTFGKDAAGVNQGRANVWMSYAEVQLYLAEAAQRGLISTGSAQTYYENAVNANLAEYGLSSSAAAYLSGTGNFVTAADKLQLIYRELWVSTYLKGNQGWDLIRRVGSLGNLVKEVSVSVRPGLGIPTRLSYPANEKDLNNDNWAKACADQGISESNNLLFGKMWWQP